MRYIVDITGEQQEAIQALIAERKYRLPQEFILTAVQNQLYLEQRNSDSDRSSDVEIYEKPMKFQSNANLQIFGANGIQTVEEPKNASLNFDQPLWGLANRIFPMKITVRVLGNMLANGEKFLVQKDLVENAFTVAAGLGAELARIDKRAKRKRSDKLSDALPTSIKNDKARGRFESQFVGGFNHTSGKITGAPAAYKFVNIISNSPQKIQIGLTRPGLEFAMLKNPVLDDKNFESGTLSPGEVRFLLDHIHENVLGEAQGIAIILSEISKGHSSPADFTEPIRSFFAYQKEAHAATMKVGLIGRMVELKLIERERTGLNVNFRISSLGIDTMKRYSNLQMAPRISSTRNLE